MCLFWPQFVHVAPARETVFSCGSSADVLVFMWRLFWPQRGTVFMWRFCGCSCFHVALVLASGFHIASIRDTLFSCGAVVNVPFSCGACSGLSLFMFVFFMWRLFWPQRGTVFMWRFCGRSCFHGALFLASGFHVESIRDTVFSCGASANVPFSCGACSGLGLFMWRLCENSVFMMRCY